MAIEEAIAPKTKPARLKMSYEEFLQWADEDNERVESSVLPGFWLRPAWLWQADTLDPLRDCLKR